MPIHNQLVQKLILNSIPHPTASDLDLQTTNPTMPTQASHFLRLPVELRLIIYECIFDDHKEVVLRHYLTYVSDQVSEEVMPILLRRFSGFFWTAIACHEEWYLAMKPRNKIWRMRLTNVSELPLDAMPTIHTKVSFHLLVGRRVHTHKDLLIRMIENRVPGKPTSGSVFKLEKHDQQDGVKRLVGDIFNRLDYDKTQIWFERGRADAPGLNEMLTERVWHQQWPGGERRGPSAGWLCRVEMGCESDDERLRWRLDV